MPRESEQRIRDLCRKVLAMKEDSQDLSPAVEELRAAIREHCDGFRERIVELAFLVAKESDKAA